MTDRGAFPHSGSILTPALSSPSLSLSAFSIFHSGSIQQHYYAQHYHPHRHHYYHHPHYRSKHTWNSIYVDSSRNDLNYSCSEAKYSIRSEEKVQTIIPVLWIVLKPVSAQFDAVVPAGSPPRLRSMWHSSPGGRATPPIVLGGNYTDYHYTLVQGCRGELQTNSDKLRAWIIISVVIKAIIQFIPLV